MKLPRFHFKKTANKFLFSDFLENMVNLGCLIACLCLIGGSAVASLMFTFGSIEFFFPNKLHIINYKITSSTFEELYQRKNYHAAIYLAELDTAILNDPGNIPLLANCYSHFGMYAKAEQFWQRLNELPADTTQLSGEDRERVERYLFTARILAARGLFQLYEKTGDREGQQRAYTFIKDNYKDPRLRQTMDETDEENYSEEERSNSMSLYEELNYHLCRGLRWEDPTAAADSLYNFLIRVYPLTRLRPEKKLEYTNTYIQWCIEDNRPLRARVELADAARFIPYLKNDFGMEPLGDYAELCYRLQNVADARRYMGKYLRYMRRTYRQDDIEYQLATLRSLKYSRAEYSQSEFIDQLVTLCEGIRNTLSQNIPAMTTESQDYLVEQLSEPFALALTTLGEYPDDPRLSRLCLENETFKRELLLRSDRLLRQALAASTDRQLLSDYQTYLSYSKELIARSYVSGPGNYARKLFLKAETQELAKRLTAGCSEFALANQASVTVRQLSRSLGSNEWLATFIEIPTPAGNTLGCITLNAEGETRYTPLCTPTQLDQLAKSDILRLCVTPYTYQTLFAPLVAQLPKQSTVYYSPTGILHRIPLGALQTHDGQVLADHYNLSVLSSPRSLLAQGSQPKLNMRQATFALWGGIDYGQQSLVEDSLPLTRAIVRGSSLRPLPGSKAEVESIVNLLHDQQLEVHCFTGANATERSFKEEVPKATIAHVSTHGFFTEDSAHTHTEAMHNAGLFFANANPAWKNDLSDTPYRYGFEDGILRAEEIVPEDLTHCDLVVLSACETGLGVIQGNEGVYGLQRAFKLAGVRCLLMSLWSVPDAATAELMRRFYQQLIVSGDMDEAFREAQRSMRQSQYPDPLFGVQDWGGFLLIH